MTLSLRLPHYYDRFRIHNNGLGALVLLDHGDDFGLDSGKSALCRNPGRHFGRDHCCFPMGSPVQTYPQCLALGCREFDRMDRRVYFLSSYFRRKPGHSVGTGARRGGWDSTVVPAPQGSRLGRMVDRDQPPGLDNRPDSGPRIVFLGGASRRFDRPGIGHPVQICFSGKPTLSGGLH